MTNSARYLSINQPWIRSMRLAICVLHTYGQPGQNHEASHNVLHTYGQPQGCQARLNCSVCSSLPWFFFRQHFYAQMTNIDRFARSAGVQTILGMQTSIRLYIYIYTHMHDLYLHQHAHICVCTQFSGALPHSN